MILLQQVMGRTVLTPSLATKRRQRNNMMSCCRSKLGKEEDEAKTIRLKTLQEPTSGGDHHASAAPESVTGKSISMDALPDVVLLKIFGDGYLTCHDLLKCVGLNKFLHHWFHDTNDDEMRPLKDFLWRKILAHESLPGETFQDLQMHFKAWKVYCDELKQTLFQLSGAVDESDDAARVEKCQMFVLEAIRGYTCRVSNSHSWYKHLPTARDNAWFVLFLDLTSNMRFVNDEWIPCTEDDGTRFHYTWTTTEKYRKLYGNFNYGFFYSQRQIFNPRVISNLRGKQIYIPRSACMLVPVTSAVHSYTGFGRYAKALKTAIDSGDPDILDGEMPRGWSFFHHVEGGKLPKGAAADLKAVANAHLAEGDKDSHLDELWRTRFPDFLNEGMTKPNEIEAWASVAMTAQHIRELISIGRALHTVSVNVFGEEFCPPLKTVESSVTPRRDIPKRW
jgi:hypothetical protein